MSGWLKVPGAPWVALLVFLAPWLTTYFHDASWVPWTLSAIGIALKLLEVFMTEPTIPVGDAQARGVGSDVRPPSKLLRFLGGG